MNKDRYSIITKDRYNIISLIDIDINIVLF